MANTFSYKPRIIALIKIIILSFLSVCSTFYTQAQGCDCPALTSCGTCAGGLTSLTLRYNGPDPALITVSDLGGEVFSDVVDSQGVFSFIGSIPNQKFQGPNITLNVDGTLITLIPSICGSTLVGSVYGGFTVIAGTSKDGGALCCPTTALETIPPVITNCPQNFSVNLPSTNCSMSVNWLPPSATDNCALESFISTYSPADILPLGNTIVVYTAVDVYGNSSQCLFTVTVNDTSLPVITNCPSDIIIVANSSCEAIGSWTPPLVSDNCTVELTSSHSPGSVFTFGTTLVTYTATDQVGNVSRCTFNVVVTNPNNPTIADCPNTINVTATENGEASVTWREPQASTMCGDIAVTKSHEPGSTFSVGTSTVIYKFTDDTGKFSTCTFDVVVREADGEVIISKAVTPDGDGINDVWLLENIEKYEDNTVVVVDRWGNKIFQATGYDNETVFWDGTNQSGVVVPTGTYFFIIEVQFQGTVVKKTGYLEVIQ